MVDTKQIQALLDKHFLLFGPVTLIDAHTGLVDVDGSVYLRDRPRVKRLPVKFEHTRDFHCNNNSLTTLEGAPHSVRGSFDCHNNQLTSLAHSPEYVEGAFWCGFNKLKNLVGAPTSVGDDFVCRGNPLESLDGLPSEIDGVVRLDYDANLPLLRLLVAKRGVDWWQTRTPVPEPVAAILEKYKGQGQAASLICAAELSAAGFKGNARW